MSGVENYLRQKAAEARRENPNLISGEELVRRVGEAREAARQEEAAMHARTADLVAQAEAMIEKLKGQSSGGS